MPGTGWPCYIAHVLPDDFEITCVRTFGSTPKPSAIRKASLTATIATPAIRLLQIFATSPAPTGPTWMTVLPIASRTGRASSVLRVAAHHDRERARHRPRHGARDRGV